MRRSLSLQRLRKCFVSAVCVAVQSSALFQISNAQVPKTGGNTSDTAGGTVPGSLETDRQALLAFYESLTNKTALVAGPQPWNVDGLPCNGSTSDWRGITCADGRVVGVSLAGLGLAGPFPPSLAGLYGLRNLTMNMMMATPYNKWTGPLPSSWGNLSRLELLAITQRPFNVGAVFLGAPMQGSSIPPSWANLKNLRSAQLKFLNLTGPLPVAWKGMQSLRRLDLSTNWMTGQLPPEWAQEGLFSNLTLLDVSCNLLTGTVPPVWFGPGAFHTLQAMLLTSNKLTGPLPKPVNSSAVSTLTSEGVRGGFAIAALPQLQGFGFCGSVPAGLAVYGDPAAGRQGNTWLMNTTLPPITQFDIPCPGTEVQGPSHAPWNWPLWGLLIAVAVMLTLIALWVYTLFWRRYLSRKAKLRGMAAGWKSDASSEGTLKAWTPDRSDESFLEMGGKEGRRRSSSSTITGGKYSLYSSLTNSRSLDIWGGSTFSSDSWDVVKPSEVCIAEQNGQPWLLGEGSYGKVFKGLLDGVHVVAIKIFAGEAMNADKDGLNKEIHLLRSCRSSHIVQFQGMAKVDNDIWLLMEYMEKGNLCNALAKDSKCRWYQKGGQIALDIAHGMGFLHSKGVIHLDLKSPNVLLTGNYTAKIADVGLSHMIGSQSHASQLMAGSFHWMAPEVMVYHRATYKADVFSFGVILWEICSGLAPKRGRLSPVSVPRDCPQEVADLIDACLHQDFTQRPSAKEVILKLASVLQVKDGLDSDVEDAASEEMETRGMLSSYLLDPIVEAWMSDPETLGLPDPASSSQGSPGHGSLANGSTKYSDSWTSSELPLGPPHALPEPRSDSASSPANSLTRSSALSGEMHKSPTAAGCSEEQEPTDADIRGPSMDSDSRKEGLSQASEGAVKRPSQDAPRPPPIATPFPPPSPFAFPTNI